MRVESLLTHRRNRLWSPALIRPSWQTVPTRLGAVPSPAFHPPILLCIRSAIVLRASCHMLAASLHLLRQDDPPKNLTVRQHGAAIAGVVVVVIRARVPLTRTAAIRPGAVGRPAHLSRPSPSFKSSRLVHHPGTRLSYVLYEQEAQHDEAARLLRLAANPTGSWETWSRRATHRDPQGSIGRTSRFREFALATAGKEERKLQ